MYRIVGLSLILLFAFFGGSGQVLAFHTDNSRDIIPEKNGVYNDPDHPGIKVRVFVHPEKPFTTESAALTCDLSDPASTAKVSGAGWHLPPTVTYNLNLSSVPSSVGGVNVPTIALNGFSDWKVASGNKVNFTQGSNTTVDRSRYDNKNIIAWGRTNGSALGVTYVRYYSATGLVVDVDTIMNKKFQWRWSGSNTCAYPDGYDAEDILTHEQGHWLGLDDEYDAALFQHATMYGYGSAGEVKKVTLEQGDKDGVFSLYNP